MRIRCCAVLSATKPRPLFRILQYTKGEIGNSCVSFHAVQTCFPSGKILNCYPAAILGLRGMYWSYWTDLNRRPAHYKCAALLLSYPRMHPRLSGVSRHNTCRFWFHAKGNQKESVATPSVSLIQCITDASLWYSVFPQSFRFSAFLICRRPYAVTARVFLKNTLKSSLPECEGFIPRDVLSRVSGMVPHQRLELRFIG